MNGNQIFAIFIITITMVYGVIIQKASCNKPEIHNEQ